MSRIDVINIKSVESKLEVNKIMAKDTTWHGVDVSNEISLFEYGFLIRWNKKDKMYDTIFMLSEDAFVYDRWDGDEYRKQLAHDTEELKSIADMCGTNADTYLDETLDVHLLSDLISYHGMYEITDYYRTHHTKAEVRKKLNKALY